MKAVHIGFCIAMGAALAAAAPVLAAPNQSSGHHAAHPASRHAAAAQSQDSEDEGQQVFEQNCAHCHNAPDGFSRRITGTIVTHMRVRANLSQHDERVLLHYFNP